MINDICLEKIQHLLLWYESSEIPFHLLYVVSYLLLFLPFGAVRPIAFCILSVSSCPVSKVASINSS